MVTESKTLRYAVQSEHVRGERRWYFVIDLQHPASEFHHGSMGVQADGTHGSHDQRTAQRQCNKLNGLTV